MSRVETKDKCIQLREGGEIICLGTNNRVFWPIFDGFWVVFCALPHAPVLQT